jgi:hypothetical protein
MERKEEIREPQGWSDNHQPQPKEEADKTEKAEKPAPAEAEKPETQESDKTEKDPE